MGVVNKLMNEFQMGLGNIIMTMCSDKRKWKEETDNLQPILPTKLKQSDTQRGEPQKEIKENQVLFIWAIARLLHLYGKSTPHQNCHQCKNRQEMSIDNISFSPQSLSPFLKFCSSLLNAFSFLPKSCRWYLTTPFWLHSPLKLPIAKDFRLYPPQYNSGNAHTIQKEKKFLDGL